MASLPDHDPKRDGNRFRWIVRTVKAVREQRRISREAEIARINHGYDSPEPVVAPVASSRWA